MKSFLPIITLGNAEPVRVPCALPESFTFHAFLPSRGVREFTAFLTSRDPLEAELGDVLLTGKEGDPRGPSGFEVEDDEQARADEAAGDVLEAVLRWFGLCTPTATPSQFRGADVLPAIARAYLAELAAYEAVIQAHRALPRTLASPATIQADPRESSEPWASAARAMLEKYVEHVLEHACLAQREKSEKQRDEWASEYLGDPRPSGSELGRF